MSEEWRKYYPLPLLLDEYVGSFVWSRTDKGMMMAFSVIAEWKWNENMARRLLADIVGKINGTKTDKLPYKFSLSDDGEIILMDGEEILLVRGWGMLTGMGAYNLPSEKASEIQGGFIGYCVNKLNE